ncbi:winged helix-turn-helix transcriptional regulator [Paenibacillus sp. CGMCC 1.16610]|uniref:Metalloregulator ArsR/SmtB family transcription factor n=1 Tax=Paenibacillus anseongense TaxID=2682845 RepID=A0ABW9UN52_9BACL|nr:MULTISPECIES: metalloregulator ArsR/SmtB family transcription factor [Paenibacillus]MBA2941334.1 winged helix-turn-helix transcriptional regulator [Paenibacillus sp. CGMCC 1.16610]MVQ40153.1 metalloregulator ArsR/SmtB family transcription factor [Paenibacillus anseongense]
MENDPVDDFDQLNVIKADFKASGKVLAAIGDETRQHIIMVLIAAGCEGVRVGEITAQTHLSRPAVSHHLKILKDAGIVLVYKVAAMNYYYLDLSSWINNLKMLTVNIENMLLKQSSKGGQ